MSKSKIFLIFMILGGGALVYLKVHSKSAADSASKLILVDSITHGHGLAVDIADSNKLYIATHHGLLVLISEKELYKIGNSQDDYMGFSIHPTLANVFFSSGHPSGGGNMGVMKSEDEGLKWQRISNGADGPVDFHAMAISPVNPDLMYGWYKGNVQRSDDGGKNWNIINNNLLVTYLAADPKDENTVYAASPNGQGVLVSKNKGIDWQSLSEELKGGAVTTLAIDPNNPKNMLVFSERLGGLARSMDGGLKWNKIDDNFDNQAILHLAYDKNNSSITYVLTHKNSIYKSLNSGDSWQKIY